MKRTSIDIVIAIIFLSIGVVFGNFMAKKVSRNNSPDTFQAGWNAAKERLKQSSFPAGIPDGVAVTTLSGSVQKVDGNKIQIKINPIDPLADPDLDVRIVDVNSATKIYQYVSKDPAEVQKEMEDFQAKMAQPQDGQGELPGPPVTSDKKEVSIADIKQNQQISITTPGDIRNNKEFAAAEITF